MAWNNGGSEQGRLGALYGEMSDGELLGLHKTAGDLTEVAQVALAAEMKRRGISAAVEEEAVVEAAEDVGVGWRTLHVFSQTFEAQAAFRILERDGIEFAVEDRTVDERGNPVAGPAVQLALLVAAEDWTRAVTLLRREAGLFPEAVVDPGGEDGEAAEEAMCVVGDFEEDADVAEAARALDEAGIRYATVRHEEGSWRRTSVEVRADDQGRAIVALESLLPLEEGEE